MDRVRRPAAGGTVRVILGTGATMNNWLLAATAVGAISLYLMLPRGRRRMSQFGALLGVLALGGGFVELGLWLSHGPLAAAVAPAGIFFYVFAAIALASAVGVVCHPRPIYCALYFVLVTLSVAALLILLLAEFMAVVLIVIYAGAILVTYVFVIMLASPAGGIPAADYDRVSADPLLAVLVSFVFLGMILQLLFGGPREGFMRLGTPLASGHAAAAGSFAGLAALGADLYSRYALPLELAGILLTISLVGAVMISRKHEPVARILGAADVPTE